MRVVFPRKRYGEALSFRFHFFLEVGFGVCLVLDVGFLDLLSIFYLVVNR